MNCIEWMISEPMKYWQPSKDKHIELDIISNPSKYSDYIGAYKKDGEWSRVIITDDVIIQSRSISKVTGEYGRKEELVPHLVEGFKKLPKETVILGELYFEDLNKRSKDIGSILRCLPAKAIARQKDNPLHFYCFDVLCWDGQDISCYGFEERIKYIDKIKEILGDQYYEYLEIKTVEEIALEYDEYLGKGGEGFLLQRKDAIYTPGTRTAWKTIKLKKATEELELPVVDIIYPNKEYEGKELENWEFFEDGQPVTKRYYYGWANGVVIDNNGTLVKVTSGVTDDDAAWLASEEGQMAVYNKQVIAKVQAMEIEKDTGSMRHPSLIELRTDL